MTSETVKEKVKAAKEVSCSVLYTRQFLISLSFNHAGLHFRTEQVKCHSSTTILGMLLYIVLYVKSFFPPQIPLHFNFLSQLRSKTNFFERHKKRCEITINELGTLSSKHKTYKAVGITLPFFLFHLLPNFQFMM